VWAPGTRRSQAGGRGHPSLLRSSYMSARESRALQQSPLARPMRLRTGSRATVKRRRKNLLIESLHIGSIFACD